MRAKPILQAISHGIRDVGENPAAANLVKLAGNFIGFSVLESLAEAAALAELEGLPRATLLTALTETIFSTPMYKRFAGHIIKGDFDHAEFTAELGLKDMTYAKNSLDRRSVSLPFLQILCDRFKQAVDNGQGSADATVMALGAAHDAKLDWSPISGTK